MGAMIPQDLLDMLVCPLCKEAVIPKKDGTGLKCTRCNRVYPIQDDIPIMLVDAATVEPQ
ncbi:MAG: Trm112 family protein [Terriglobales bacterium]